LHKFFEIFFYSFKEIGTSKIALKKYNLLENSNKFDSNYKSVGDLEKVTDQEEDIPSNKVFRCNKCSGKFCWDDFIDFKIRTESVTCDPGQICWVCLAFKSTIK